MKAQRVACLTEYEAQVLGRLYAYREEAFLESSTDLVGFCQPQHLGGSRQSHHGRTLKRLEQRGLCEKKTVGDAPKREVVAYRITPVGLSIWNMYCEHTGEQSNAVPALRSLLMGLR